MKMRPIHQAQRYLASPTDRVLYTAAGTGMPRLTTICNQVGAINSPIHANLIA
jgi:hypothetical protein